MIWVELDLTVAIIVNKIFVMLPVRFLKWIYYILANDLTERRPSFHLGGNDDDLSNDSIPTTSPATKHTGDDDSSKRVRQMKSFYTIQFFFSSSGFKSITFN